MILFIPVERSFNSCLSKVKSGKSKKAIFVNFSQGLRTNKNDWLYDFSTKNLISKVKYFINHYEKKRKGFNASDLKKFIADTEIKWTEELVNHLEKNHDLTFQKGNLRELNFRPFIKMNSYVSDILTHRFYQNKDFFGKKVDHKNELLSFSGISHNHEFQIFYSQNPIDYDFLEKPQCIALYRYTSDGTREDNITDWGLAQFQEHYSSVIPRSKARTTKESPNNKGIASAKPRNDAQKEITKEDIFHYTYGVLHNPAYREKYTLNLKREFPRLPFYEDFWQWATWGKKLMELHIGYEAVEPYPLKTVTASATKQSSSKETDTPSARDDVKLKVKLKADKAEGTIQLDEQTSLLGIPPEAWDYKLGNRTALEWILDQYKEKKPRDKTIAEKFNTYRFADYKEEVIDLLKRVCTVSVETVRVVEEMRKKSI